jgi:enoyl-CoA hydratase/carnithine racemase
MTPQQDATWTMPEVSIGAFWSWVGISFLTPLAVAAAPSWS